jgi:chemotaxis protein MotC
MRRACALVVALSLPFGAVAAERGGAQQPYEIVRLLQEVQEQLARGNGAAIQQQAVLMGQISQRFASGAPELWRDQRNLRAAVTYLLSGGQAQAIKVLPDPEVVGKNDDTLLRGAYAYAVGRDAQALRLLGEVDPRSLAPSLAGHVALIQASLSRPDDAPKVIALLDVARLMSPGTLVEEAALRRELVLVAKIEDFDKFLSLARQYLDRFRQSIYMDNFVDVFAVGALQLGLTRDGARLARLEPVVDQLQPDVRRRLYLQIARAAAIKGAIVVARRAAERAAEIAEPGTADAARARLYAAAALIATDDFESGVERLRSVEQAPLAPRDAELRQAVSGLAKRLRAWPEGPGPNATAAQPGPLGPPPATARPLATAATIASAERAAASAAALLQGAPR